MHDAVLWDRVGGGDVACHVCLQRCRIAPGEEGDCRARINRDGSLYTLIYGQAAEVALEPIEKKPLHHFHPGSRVLTAGTRGCSFRCGGCANAALAHDRPRGRENLFSLSPRRQVELAVDHGAQGVAWSYNEPVIWIEHVVETAELAHRQGLFSVCVTNGSATAEALDLLAPHVDAWRCDLKAFSDPVLRRLSGGVGGSAEIRATLLRAQRVHGMHVECVTNVVPGINDAEAELRPLARWIAQELGPSVPWHLTRFFPAAGMRSLPPTPLATLERALEIGRDEGLRHLYLGGVGPHPARDTRCHGCGQVVIHRDLYVSDPSGLDARGRCRGCGDLVPLVGRARPAEAGSGQRQRV